MRRLVWAGFVLVAIVAILFVFLRTCPKTAPRMNKWCYQHLVSLDEKVRRLNEESPWNTDEGMLLSFPGGCGLIPYSEEIVMILSLDPLRLATRDEATGEVDAMAEINDRTFQFIAKHYPIQVTVLVLDVLQDGCKINIRADKISSSP